ncbi:amidohydrolase family protein [Cupriavidus necator]|uniref:amidohydrolase family protein n=1 Tax=Cupriavidus necator TaxID=106590 RepID=UPI00068D3531|nr:amidohydrolase family protein [Cupriavidus necator]
MKPNKEVLKDFFVVSADSHVNEPHDLWSTRVPDAFKARMPRIEVDAQGQKWFVMEGRRPSKIREAPRDAGVDVEAFKEQDTDERPRLDRTAGAMFQKVGNIDERRYRDMDYDGIDVEIVFPNKGLANWSSPDPEHNKVMCRVYNDWVSEAFKGRNRSLPVACIAPADIEAAVLEIQRVARLGFHSVMMPPLVGKRGYNSPDFDPVWAALSDANLPVLFHAGTGKDPRTAGGNGGAVINYVVHAMNTVLEPVVQICSSGVFDRFPRLKFATIEAGAGWVPYALWAMDHGYEKHAFWVTPKLKYKPSEYFRMHGHASFQDDPIGIETRHWMGVDAVMWGNDYPHLEGTWPHSKEVIDAFGDITREEKAKIIGLNAARLFHIDVPEALRVPAPKREPASA